MIGQLIYMLPPNVMILEQNLRKDAIYTINANCCICFYILSELYHKQTA
jgi:hypothetical protein